MLRKLLFIAITSGFAAKLYRGYVSKSADKPRADTLLATTRRRRAGTLADRED